MTNVSTIRTLALKSATIIDVSLCVQAIRRDDVWMLGDDASAIAAIAADLKILADVMSADLRDDLSIRIEATRLVRILERRADRDFELELLDLDPCDMMMLLYPDAYDALDDMQPIPMGTYTIVPTQIDLRTSATGVPVAVMRTDMQAA